MMQIAININNAKQNIHPPKPPLTCILREGVINTCQNCNSSVSRNGFLGIFGEMLCHNKECYNSYSKKFYK